MTLILTVANQGGLYQSSDYQLTDANTFRPVTDSVGSKQLQLTLGRCEIRLAFTGIAELGRPGFRRRTIDWLGEALTQVSLESDLKQVCQVLALKCGEETSALPCPPPLTLVITAASVSGPGQVAVVTNANWHQKPPAGKSAFKIDIRTVTKPFHLIAGCRDCVPSAAKNRLKALARSRRSPDEMMAALAEINEAASKRSGGCVSAGCLVAATTVEGGSVHHRSRNIGAHEGVVPTIVGQIDISKMLAEQFDLSGLRFQQSVGVMPGAGKPIPAPTGPVRQFSVSLTPVVVTLRNRDGSPLGEVAVTAAENVVQAKLNQEVSIPLGRLSFTPIPNAEPVRGMPKRPWPQFSVPASLDGVSIPRGCQLSIGYWTDNGKRQLQIPLTSRGIRRLAFVGSEEELVLVIPTDTITLELDHSTRLLDHEIIARVWWRARLDGTKD